MTSACRRTRSLACVTMSQPQSIDWPLWCNDPPDCSHYHSFLTLIWQYCGDIGMLVPKVLEYLSVTSVFPSRIAVPILLLQYKLSLWSMSRTRPDAVDASYSWILIEPFMCAKAIHSMPDVSIRYSSPNNETYVVGPIPPFMNRVQPGDNPILQQYFTLWSYKVYPGYSWTVFKTVEEHLKLTWTSTQKRITIIFCISFLSE